MIAKDCTEFSHFNSKYIKAYRVGGGGGGGWRGWNSIKTIWRDSEICKDLRPRATPGTISSHPLIVNYSHSIQKNLVCFMNLSWIKQILLCTMIFPNVTVPFNCVQVHVWFVLYGSHGHGVLNYIATMYIIIELFKTDKSSSLLNVIR